MVDFRDFHGQSFHSSSKSRTFFRPFCMLAFASATDCGACGKAFLGSPYAGKGVWFTEC